MFNIISFTVDEISGRADLKVSYQSHISGAIKDDGGSFKSRQNALNWLEQTKKLYFGLRVDNFLIHKRFIIENAPGHKTITHKKEVLTELFRYSKWMAETATISEACKWFLLVKDKFYFILPGQNNPSRESAETELNNLIKFAEAELKK
jgi:hypothetical protein